MSPLPLDKRDRVFGALCDDLIDIASGKAARFARTDAIREIIRTTREGGSKLPSSNQ